MPGPSIHGGKHTCAGCATRFFDLGKSPAICPSCKQKVVVLVRVARRSKRLTGDIGAQKSAAAKDMLVITAPAPKLKQVKWK